MSVLMLCLIKPLFNLMSVVWPAVARSDFSLVPAMARSDFIVVAAMARTDFIVVPAVARSYFSLWNTMTRIEFSQSSDSLYTRYVLVFRQILLQVFLVLTDSLLEEGKVLCLAATLFDRLRRRECI
uniref:Secreted protein n=1 Tax=Cacopsylla melanoneura TaxID=428564 RepID=A0A8D8QWG9_9HEMI